jgi:hypothetical protein
MSFIDNSLAHQQTKKAFQFGQIPLAFFSV